MPRFFFDLHDGPNKSPDIYGDDFISFDEARQHAQAILADLVGEELPNGEERSFLCEVRDDEHDIVYRCQLRLHGESMPKLDKAR